MTRPPAHDFNRTNRLNDLRIEYLHLMEAAKKAKTIADREAKTKIAEKKFVEVHEEGYEVYTSPSQRAALAKVSISEAAPVGAGLRQQRNRGVATSEHVSAPRTRRSLKP